MFKRLSERKSSEKDWPFFVASNYLFDTYQETSTCWGGIVYISNVFQLVLWGWKVPEVTPKPQKFLQYKIAALNLHDVRFFISHFLVIRMSLSVIFSLQSSIHILRKFSILITGFELIFGLLFWFLNYRAKTVSSLIHF